jgi:hypothetical protein
VWQFFHFLPGEALALVSAVVDAGLMALAAGLSALTALLGAGFLSAVLTV